MYAMVVDLPQWGSQPAIRPGPTLAAHDSPAWGPYLR